MINVDGIFPNLQILLAQKVDFVLDMDIKKNQNILKSLLSLDEFEQYLKLRSWQQTNYFIKRVLVKTLVGGLYPELNYTQISTANSKNEISLPNQKNIYYSISDSGDYILACVWLKPIGIDLERVGSRIKLLTAIALESELEILTKLKIPKKLLTNLIWSIKESCMKIDTKIYPFINYCIFNHSPITNTFIVQRNDKRFQVYYTKINPNYLLTIAKHYES
ncbi:MAG: 4'-phosphopantetheinyl transferase superfamily protein [bacterium]